MSTSPGSSSPRDLNIAPLAVAAVTTQTRGGLLTPPVQKRLEADISNQMLLGGGGERARAFPGFERPAKTRISSVCGRRFTAEDGATARAGGRRARARSNASGQLVCRPGGGGGQSLPPTPPATRAGPGGAAGRGPATCGQCETFITIHFHFSSAAFSLFHLYPGGLAVLGKSVDKDRPFISSDINRQKL